MKTISISSFIFQVPLVFKKAPKTLSAASEGLSFSTPLTLKNTTDSDHKKGSQLLLEEAASLAAEVPAIFESEEDDLSEEEVVDHMDDMEMPHRYSKDPKDRKDVNGVSVILSVLEIYFLSNQPCSIFYSLPFIQF